MAERALAALALIVFGVLAYRGALVLQRRRAWSGHAQVAQGRAQLLVFTSPQCAPCKYQQLPIVEQLRPEWADRLDLRVIDVTEQPEVANRYGVWSLPTTLVLDAGGKVVALNNGVTARDKLAAQLAQAAGRRVAAETRWAK